MAIIEGFVRAYNKERGVAYRIAEWPEDTEHKKHSSKQRKAIDALAVDSSSRRLGLEPTAIEAFEGATGSDARFKPFISTLRNRSARLPGHHIIIYLRLDSTEGLRRARRERLAAEFRQWFDEAKTGLPAGMSEHTVKLRDAQLTVQFCKRHLQDDYPGLVTVQRYPQPSPISRLHRAVQDKLPKLRDLQADERVLLLERRDYDTPNSWAIHDGFERLEKLYDISCLSEVWLVDTSQLICGDCARGGPYVEFNRVWPTLKVLPFFERIDEQTAAVIRRER